MLCSNAWFFSLLAVWVALAADSDDQRNGLGENLPVTGIHQNNNNNININNNSNNNDNNDNNDNDNNDNDNDNNNDNKHKHEHKRKHKPKPSSHKSRPQQRAISISQVTISLFIFATKNYLTISQLTIQSPNLTIQIHNKELSTTHFNKQTIISQLTMHLEELPWVRELSWKGDVRKTDEKTKRCQETGMRRETTSRARYGRDVTSQYVTESNCFWCTGH